MGAALGATRAIRSLRYETQAADPLAVSGSLVLLIVAAVVIKPAEFLQQVCSELIVVGVTVVASIVASPTLITYAIFRTFEWKRVWLVKQRA
jgi:hypothetical protein